MTENALITKGILEARFDAVEELIEQTADTWLIEQLRAITAKANIEAGKFLVNQQRLQGFIALLQNHNVQHEDRSSYPEGRYIWVVDGVDAYDAGMDDEDAEFAWLYDIDRVYNFDYYIETISVTKRTKEYVLRQLELQQSE